MLKLRAPWWCHRGVACDACITWLADTAPIGRAGNAHRQFDADAAVSPGKQTICTEVVPPPAEVPCTAPERAKERGIASASPPAPSPSSTRAARPRAHKRLAQVWQRIGRLRQRFPRAYQAVTAARPARKPSPSPGRRPQDGSMAIPASTACAAARPTGTKTRGAPHHAHRRRSRLPLANPSSARRIYHKPRGPTATAFGPSSPTSSCRSGTRLCAVGEHGSFNATAFVEGQHRTALPTADARPCTYARHASRTRTAGYLRPRRRPAEPRPQDDHLHRVSHG